MFAIFAHLQSFFEQFFIFTRKIVNLFAFSTLEFDHVILGHISNLIYCYYLSRPSESN